MKWLFVVCFFFLTSSVFCQIKVSGYIRDSLTGENLAGVNIFEPLSGKGVISNPFGFYSLSLPGYDSLIIVYSYIGYTPQHIQLKSVINQNLDIALKSGIDLDEVVVSYEKHPVNVPEISIVNIPIEQIKRIPAFMGEADVLRAFQLMPGIQGGKEGTSGIYVRGGSPDQNLILLDDIPLYFVNHIGGFISVFNPEAIKSVDLYKGGFPARFGGRLSSIMDIRMKEGNMKEYSGNISVGILSSKFTIEGPVKEDKTSFIISARRSMVDLFTRGYQLLETDGKYSPGYTLYDLNTKINHIIDPKNRLFLSLYSGRDRLFIKQSDFTVSPDFPFKLKSENDLNWGNHCLALRWNHVYSNQLFSNITFGYTRFFYNSESDVYKADKDTDKIVGTLSNHYNSSIDDILGKIDFDYYLSEHQLKFGGGTTLHKFVPNMSKFQQSGSAEIPVDISYGSQITRPLEFYSYFEDSYNMSNKLSINAGIHWSNFWVYDAFYPSLQPRLISNYKLNENLSIKASYTRMTQAVHLLSKSTAGLQADLWVPATRDVPPQNSSLLVIGVAGNTFLTKQMAWSVESFYKRMNKLIEFSDGASFFSGSADWQDKIEKNGKGSVYGFEFLVQKKQGKTTGWIAYTWSKNMRIFENLNNGEPFPYKYDRRHDISITFNHKFNEETDFSAVWVFATGKALTLPSAQYEQLVLDMENMYFLGYFYDEVHIYDKRNNYREPNYHRLDLALNFTKELTKGIRIFSLGLYNSYNHMNPYYLYFDLDKNGNKKLYSYTLFPVIPSFSYNYKF